MCPGSSPGGRLGGMTRPTLEDRTEGARVKPHARDTNHKSRRNKRREAAAEIDRVNRVAHFHAASANKVHGDWN